MQCLQAIYYPSRPHFPILHLGHAETPGGVLGIIKKVCQSKEETSWGHHKGTTKV